MKEYIITDVDEKNAHDFKYLTGRKVAELIRCKDCKYRYDGKDDSPCELYEMPLNLPRDFHCASGEMKHD